jgi:hypothetical protein
MFNLERFSVNYLFLNKKKKRTKQGLGVKNRTNNRSKTKRRRELKGKGGRGAILFVVPRGKCTRDVGRGGHKRPLNFLNAAG